MLMITKQGGQNGKKRYKPKKQSVDP